MMNSRRKGTHSSPSVTRISCLVCGAETDLSTDLPLAEIKKSSREAIEALIRGRWKEGLAAAAKCESLASKHLSRPLMEVTEVQIAIWKGMWLKYGTMKLVKMI